MSASINIRRCSETGVWGAEWFYLTDDIGNSAWLHAEDLLALGFSTILSVESTGMTCKRIQQTSEVGSRVLPVASSSGLLAGDWLRINECGESQEDVQLADLRTMAIVLALRHRYVAGETVTRIAAGGGRTVFLPVFSRSSIRHGRFAVNLDMFAPQRPK